MCHVLCHLRCVPPMRAVCNVCCLPTAYVARHLRLRTDGTTLQPMSASTDRPVRCIGSAGCGPRWHTAYRSAPQEAVAKAKPETKRWIEISRIEACGPERVPALGHAPLPAAVAFAVSSALAIMSTPYYIIATIIRAAYRLCDS
jgi:hypothetical protein